MEAHLSLAFDNLSSYDGGKIRKGLRQVEGLLAQVCLSKHKPTTPAERRRSVASPGNGGAQTGPKELTALKDDAGFREFFRLQDGFEWNGMVGCRCMKAWRCAADTLFLSGPSIDHLFGSSAWQRKQYVLSPEKQEQKNSVAASTNTDQLDSSQKQTVRTTYSSSQPST